jgi:LAO/AO transport system kinase
VSAAATGKLSDPERLADGVRKGDRRALARAITLVESSRPEQVERGERLLEALLPVGGTAVRLGITGTPGAGKSTFIEAFGLEVAGRGQSIAVLAVDPSSRLSGGSILGDKTRMQRLSQTGRAYIRPSPAGNTPGGVARRTREASLICEAAGFNVVLIETVGVGQSETAVADMVDGFVLLLAPGAGDELQGIKRGIVELADLVVVNKADGGLRAAAEAAATAYRSALQLLVPTEPDWRPEVLLCSALEGQGIGAVLDAVHRHRAAIVRSGGLERRRRAQGLAWLESELDRGLMDLLRQSPEASLELRRVSARVAEGALSPARAAREVLAAFRGSYLQTSETKK